MNPVGTFRVRWWHRHWPDIDNGQANFRWYWQANLYSWWMHHFHGYLCSTLKKD